MRFFYQNGSSFHLSPYHLAKFFPETYHKPSTQFVARFKICGLRIGKDERVR
jgi:hypothetical protein